MDCVVVVCNNDLFRLCNNFSSINDPKYCVKSKCGIVIAWRSSLFRIDALISFHLRCKEISFNGFAAALRSCYAFLSLDIDALSVQKKDPV